MKNLYIAYGSNLDLQYMSCKCPTAKVIGKSELDGYEMLFKGDNRSGVATIEPLENGKVPVLIWDMQLKDLKALDMYEGYPFLCDKKNIDVKLENKTVSAMTYVMKEGISLSTPSLPYYNIIQEGYEKAGFDINILERAVQRTIELEQKQQEEQQNNNFNIEF